MVSHPRLIGKCTDRYVSHVSEVSASFLKESQKGMGMCFMVLSRIAGPYLTLGFIVARGPTTCPFSAVLALRRSLRKKGSVAQKRVL